MNTSISNFQAHTFYAGIRFRSRLHARWAIVFDILGIKWVYQPTAFDLPPTNQNGDNQGEAYRYNPHFHIESQNTFRKPLWITIAPCPADLLLAQRFAFHVQERVALLGDIPWPDAVTAVAAQGAECRYGMSPDCAGRCFLPPTGEDEGYLFCQCPFCGCLGFEYDGRSARVGCGCVQHKKVSNGDKTHNDCSPRLLQAYSEARSADFQD